MTIIHLEVDGVSCTVESKNNDITLPDILQLIDQCLRGVGYLPPACDLGYDEPEGE